MPTSVSMPALLIAAIVLCLVAGAMAAWLLRSRSRAISVPSCESMLAQGRDAHQEGNLVLAERAYRRVVVRIDKVQAPESALLLIKNQALVELGNLARDKGDTVSAVQQYERALAIGAVPDQALRIMAVQHARNRDGSPKAARVYGKYLASTKGDRLPDDEVVTFLTRHCEAYARSQNENELRELETLLAELLAGDPDLVWIYRDLGTVLMNTGRPGEAIVTWRRAVLLNLHDSEVLGMLGVLECQQGEAASGTAHLTESLVMHPDQPDLHNTFAQILLAEGPSLGLSQSEAIASAADHLHRARESGAVNGRLWIQLGKAQQLLGLLGEAEDAFRFAFESDAANDEFSLPLLELLTKTNRIDQAKAVASQAIAKAPQSLAAHMYLAEQALETGDWEEARTHFGVSLKSDLENQDAHRGLGVALRYLREWQEAISHLAQLQTHTQKSLLALASAYMQTGNPQLAIELLQSAPSELASGWQVLYTLGCAAARVGNWRLATESLRTAAGLVQIDEPGAGQVYFRLGIALSHLSCPDEAWGAYQRAAALLPDLPDLHYAIGHEAYLRGELESAQGSFVRTLELNPDHMEARLALGQTYQRQGDLVAATSAYRAAYSSHPSSPLARVRLAAALARSGDWDQVFALLDSVTLAELGFDGRFWLAAARAHAGQYEESVSNWEALLEEEPSDGAIRGNLSAVLIQAGRSRFQSGHFEEALAAWRRAGDIAPGQDTADPMMEASVCLTGQLLQRGNVEGAALRIESLPPTTVEDSRVRRYRGLVALARNDAATAIKELSSIADLQPACGLYQYDAAVASLVAGNGARSGKYLGRVPLELAEALPAFELVRATAAAADERWLEAMSGLSLSLTHYVQGNSGPAARYCETHAPLLVRHLLFYAQKANRLGELSTICAELARLPSTRLLGRAGLAMSMAAKGDGDNALVEVEALVREFPAEKEAQELAVEILTSQAIEELHRGGYVQALSILRRAVELSPQDACLAEAISSLVSLQATEAYRSGDFRKAVSLWEQRLDQEPGNLRVLHQLAIATYRLASPPAASDERDGTHSGAQASERPEHADNWWLRAIAYWTTLLFSDAFWRAWCETRRTAENQNVDENTLAGIRQAVQERLDSDIKDYAAATRGRIQPGEPLRLGAVEAAWEIEVQVAQLMQQWAASSTEADWWGTLSCGPLMLARLRRIPSQASQVARLGSELAAAKDPLGRRLNGLLGSLGQCQYLLDKGFYDQATELLTPFRGETQAKSLLAEAFIGKAREAAERKDWSTAWQSFKRAAEYGGNLSSVGDIAAQACIAVSDELQTSGEPDAGLRASIGHLESARKLVGDRPEIRSNLGLCYGRRSLLANNANDYRQAVKLIKTALEFDAEEPTLRHWARVAHSNLAFEMAAKDHAGAIQMLWTALSWEDTPEARMDISSALFEGKAWTAVIPFYQKWLRQDPSEAVWRHNLQAAMHNLGLEYANVGRWDQAIEHLEEALQVGADENTREMLARCYVGRATLYAQNGNHYMAKRDIELALKYDPGNYELRRLYYSL
jgi:tetratricopeptide (TPR) repeat protein